MRLLGRLILYAFVALWFPAEAQTEDPVQLWDAVVAAKGGRDRLRAVQNMVRSSRIPSKLGWKKFDRVIEEFYVFPNKYWAWVDERPTVWGLRLELVDLDSWVGYHVYPDELAPRRYRPRTDQREGWRELQAFELLETQWVRPVPVAVTEETVRKSRAKVLVCQLDIYGTSAEVKYRLGSSSLLPTEIVMTHQSLASGFILQARYEILGYNQVDGIWMPSRMMVQHGGPTYEDKLSYRFNVNYDPALFERPPVIEDGPEGWRCSRPSCR